MLDFIILGLPRSGTTWLANFYTTDKILCIHDPFARFLPDELGGQRRHHWRLGISCTGAYLLPQWLERQRCPIAVVERDPAACDASLAAMGYPPTTPLMREQLAAVRGRRWTFDDVWKIESAREMWGYLLPGVEFDGQRFRMLRDMQVQPHMGKWVPDQAIVHHLAVEQFKSQEANS